MGNNQIIGLGSLILPNILIIFGIFLFQFNEFNFYAKNKNIKFIYPILVFLFTLLEGFFHI